MDAIDVLLVLLLLTVIVGFVTYNKRTGFLKFLPWFQCSMLMLESCARVLHYKNQENMIVYDFVTMLEMSFFCGMYIFYLRRKWNKITVAVLMLVFYLSEVAYYDRWNMVLPSNYNLLSFYLSALFLIVAAIIYLVETLRSDDIIFFNQNPVIWISIGLLLYLSSSAFFMVTNYAGIVFENHELIHSVVTITSVSSLYTCLIVAMLCKRYEQ